MSEGYVQVWLFRVDRIEQRNRKVYVRGIGDKATFSERPLGWYVISGDIAFAVGHERPDLLPGDVLELRKRNEV